MTPGWRLAACLLIAGRLCAAPAAEPQGLKLTLSAGGKSDALEARLVALYLPAGQPPSPFLPPGPFTAVWEGSILSPLRAEYTFSVQSAGPVAITIGGQSLSDLTKPVQLKKGANSLRVEYRSPESGEAFVRLFWASRDFPPEPVPPTSLSHPAAPPDLVRQGRVLFAEHRCGACHDAAGALPPPGQGMPELAQDAPVFGEFGARFNETWLAHWIDDPHSIRPHALMPRLFSGTPGQVDPRAADLAAYLSSLGQRHDAQSDEADVPLGAALFANLGCIACHTAPTAEGEDEFHRTPLNHLRAKWQEPALREYLQDPQKFYRWTRMPNFRLSEAETTRLAAFLLAGRQREFSEVPKGDPAKGAQLAVTAGCLNCHAGLPPTSAPKLAETLKLGWKTGCVADDATARGQAPDFGFTPPEREALRALAAAGFDSFQADSPAEFAQRQIENLRCTACHPRDGSSSVWSQLGEEMAPLQSGAPAPEGEGQPIAGTAAPMLTWLGEKLRPEWAAQFIAGGIAYKPRPWLIARMPGFGVRAEGLAQGLAMQHGFSTAMPPDPPVEEEKAKIGQILIGENGGFNCTTCHGVGLRPPTAVFEAPGINLAYSHERLRHEYYHRWVFFPLRIDPDTKMPRFADDEGKTPLTEQLGGDARAQFEAIWQYLGTVPKPPEHP